MNRDKDVNKALMTLLSVDEDEVRFSGCIDIMISLFFIHRFYTRRIVDTMHDAHVVSIVSPNVDVNMMIIVSMFVLQDDVDLEDALSDYDLNAGITPDVPQGPQGTRRPPRCEQRSTNPVGC